MRRILDTEIFNSIGNYIQNKLVILNVISHRVTNYFFIESF